MRSLIVRITRALLLPALLFAAVAAPHIAVKVNGGSGGEDCTGQACPCVDTGGTPVGGDRICPL